MKLATSAAALALVSAFAVPAAANTTAAATPWCGADSLNLAASPPISPGQQIYLHFYVILTNVSQQTCTLQGYPGVDLVGPDDPTLGPTYSLPRQSGDVQAVVLAPGASAASLVAFLPKIGPGGWEPAWPPTTIVVTPPDSTTALQTPWIADGLTVLRQGDGTHPGGRVGPLQPYA
ncbi:DUF4232 domain-containing protein [Mycobacterium montefiorense]|uniref:DUF4232 domain-containing protein n=1 Tax=Mycobacterium montefiorense TaxID=154654 RepID=UPI0021DF327C|nr:DUF4232 domain-containing protein [Mycobacterium montefiorense]MCV7426191.1 DUF4232 domain-containing protein [Mycobacterium montefiorense]GLE54524.1 hypothetical protein ATCCBAA256_41160 [Mycobacterium montefiorense]